MNKTLYVKDEDAPTWDRAKELAGDSLSGFIMDRLKSFVAEQEAKAAGLGRIVVRTVENGVPKARAFSGKWLVPPEEPLKAYEPSVDREWGDSHPASWAVAFTGKGKFVVVPFYGEKGGDLQGAEFLILDSLDDAQQQVAGPVIEEALRRMGVMVEELDI